MTRADKKKWFDMGVELGTSFMVIAIDTFDNEPFPSYTYTPRSSIKTLEAQLNKVMEVYNLSKPFDEQETREGLFHTLAWDFGE